MPTPVIFRKDKENAEIVAVFPTLPSSSLYSHFMTCYAHVGQHSGCVLEWYRNNTTPATPNEYKDLLTELQSQGYDDLQVRQKITPAMDRERERNFKAPVEIIEGYSDDI